jgi:replicative DNA helicase
MTDLFNLEAEKAVLGSILLDNSTLPIVAGIVETRDFRKWPNEIVYQSMKEMDGPIDLLTLSEYMKDNGTLHEIAGSAYLSMLTDSVQNLSNVEHYARIVRRFGVTRRLKNGLERAAVRIINGKQLDEAMADLSPYLTAAASLDTKQEPVNAVKDAFEHLERIQCGDELGYMPLGLQNLEPFSPSPGEMVVIGAWPSVGKTALAVQLAENISTLDRPSLLVSAEMSTRAIYWRRLAALTGIDQRRFRTKGGLRVGDWDKIGNTCKDLQTESRPFYVVDGMSDVNKIEAAIRKLHIQHKIQAVFIDHLHLLRLKEGDTEEMRIGNTTKNLSLLTKELGIVTFLMSQLSKPEKGRGDNPRPRNSDLRGSGAIEANADIVWLLHREQRFEDARQQTLEVQVTKNRNGAVGLAELSMEMPSGRITDSMGQREYAQTYAAASHPED